jgi:hypothetical protein
MNILRTYLDYKPLRTFLLAGSAVSVLGFLVGLRVFFHFILTGSVSPYIPSAILTAVLLIIGFQIMLLGLIADMVGRERKLIEDIIYQLKKKDLEGDKS